MPIVSVPEFANYSHFKGCFVNGCVDRGDGSSFRAMGHAHNATGYKNFGWICIRGMKNFRNEDGSLTDTMWHELAHLETPNHGHDDVWRAKMIELGQQVVGRYVKEKRYTVRCDKCGKRIGWTTNKERAEKGYWWHRCVREIKVSYK